MQTSFRTAAAQPGKRSHTYSTIGGMNMEQRLESLFTPWKIGSCEIKNRIVLTSMGGTDLFGWMEKNHFDKAGAHFIMEVAKNNPMFGQWLYKNEKMYQDLKKWLPEFHKTGAKLFIQLTAGFGRSFTISGMMETLYSNKALRVRSMRYTRGICWTSLH